MADVAYLVPDLLFSSKIRETANRLGLRAQSARDPDGLLAAARGARLVVVDLRSPRALEALGRLASDEEARHISSVGFVDHELTEVMDQARQAGCGKVMAKGQFTAKLPELLAALAPSAPAAPGGDAPR
jgi:hypothetical protein